MKMHASAGSSATASRSASVLLRGTGDRPSAGRLGSVRTRVAVLGLGLFAAACGPRLITDFETEDDSGSDGSSTGDPTGGPGTNPLPTSPQPDSGLPPPSCGNGAVEPGEVCDGFDLAGESCESLGLGSGTLSCLPDCSGVDISGCTIGVCGNGFIEPGEICDGPDLGGQSCVLQGFEGGVLLCQPNCVGFDVSLCTSVSCGNGVIDGVEVCDGLDLGGATCQGLGLPDGLLACQPGCTDFDVAGCGVDCIESDLGQAVGPGVAAGSTVREDDDFVIGCAASGGADHVMSFTGSVPGAYVFDTVGSEYDTALAAFASCSGASQLACDDDAAGDLMSQIVVPIGAGQTVLVAVDGFSGDVGNWVLNVAAPPIPALPPCAEQDLFWNLGSPVATGNTALEDEDLTQGCAGGGAVDYVMRFIAPQGGTYVFDTVGSSYDTALSAHLDCNPGSEFACNDDTEVSVESQLVLDLSLGQSILIAVSGWSGSTGDWVLNVTKV